MNKKLQSENGFIPRHFQMMMNILMVSVMLTCFSALVGHSIGIFYPVWGAYWFPVLTFMITLITMLTRYARKFTHEMPLSPTHYSLVEAILLILLAKVVSIFYTVPLNWISIWREITSWGQNFFENFTSSDFLLRAFGLLIMWMLTWLFSSPLNQLQEDEALMEQEKLGYTFNDRYVARRRLISLVFNLGIIMIIIMVIQNSNLHLFANDTNTKTHSLVILLIYFSTAFIFLAFNQYAIMKARWYFNNIKVNPNFIKRWMLFSVFFILLVILVIVFLPTGFSLEIPELGQWIVDAFITVTSLIISIVLAPFILMALLIERLSKGDPASEPIQELIQELPEMLPQTISGTPWWDVVKSIIFWLVFIAVIISAISYYLINKPNIKGFLRDLRIPGWLLDLWKWFIQGLKQTHRVTTETIQVGLDKFQSFIKRQQVKTPGLFLFAKRLPPRQAVIVVYVDWIDWNQKHGFKRNTAQTPNEYAQTFRNYLQDPSDLYASVDKLTDLFIHARYSKQPVIKEQVQQAQQLSDLLKKDFPGQRDQQVSP
jgi:hypothetical protein